MADRPKPPSPYETWIEWILGLASSDTYRQFGDEGLYARAELAELREKAERTDWIPDALMKLLEMSQLDRNWDSYGGHPLRPKALGCALQFLGAIADGRCKVSPPTILVPVNDGGVGFQWVEPEIEFDLAPFDEPTAFASGLWDDNEFIATTLDELCKRLSEVPGWLTEPEPP